MLSTTSVQGKKKSRVYTPRKLVKVEEKIQRNQMSHEITSNNMVGWIDLNFTKKKTKINCNWQVSLVLEDSRLERWMVEGPGHISHPRSRESEIQSSETIKSWTAWGIQCLESWDSKF